MRLVRKGSQQYDKLIHRDCVVKKRVAKSVYKIVQDVRAEGDDAVSRYTRKFDKVKLKAKDLRVTQSEISAAYQDIKPEIVSVLKLVIENINKFYRKNRKKSWKIKGKDGVF